MSRGEGSAIRPREDLMPRPQWEDRMARVVALCRSVATRNEGLRRITKRSSLPSIALLAIVSGCASANLTVIKPISAPVKTVSLTIQETAGAQIPPEEADNFKLTLTTKLEGAGIQVLSTARSDALLGQVSEYDPGNRALRYLVGFGAGRARIESAWTIKDEAGQEIGACRIDGSMAMGVFGGSVSEVHLQMGDALARFLSGEGISSAEYAVPDAAQPPAAPATGAQLASAGQAPAGAGAFWNSFREVPPVSPMAMKGRDLFLCCNLAFDSHHDASDAGYLFTDEKKRVVLPVGTSVRVTDAKRDTVSFTADGQPQTFKLSLEYGNEKIPPLQFFPMILRETDPRTQIATFPADIQAGIKDGRLAYGMTREQAVMARGYPPFHRTPDLNAPTWLYYDSGDLGEYVTFTDGHITAIKAGPTP